MFKINTQRLVLRDILETDFSIIHQMRSDTDVTRYMDYIKSENVQETREWIQGTIHHNSQSPRQSYNLAIILKSKNEIIGWIGIGQADEQEYGNLDFGYALIPKYWGKGYAPEALSTLINFSFEEFGEVKRIYGECDAKNQASARVMVKAGLRRSKTEKDSDSLYVISREEWKTRK